MLIIASVFFLIIYNQINCQLCVSVFFIGNDSDATIEVQEEKNRSAWGVPSNSLLVSDDVSAVTAFIYSNEIK